MRSASLRTRCLVLAALGPARQPPPRSAASASVAQSLLAPAPAVDAARRLAAADTPADHGACAAVLDALEGLNRRPVTAAFLELGLSGSWELARYVPAVPVAAAPAGLDWLVDDADDGSEAEGFAVTRATSAFSGGAATGRGSVSYTHLTLPTICSV